SEKGNLSYLADDRAIRDRSGLNKRRRNRVMKLEINVPVSGLDLASLLDGEQGLFLCQNRGQNYITIAKAGHSIAFGPTPIGKAIEEKVRTSTEPDAWLVTKMSNSAELADCRTLISKQKARTKQNERAARKRSNIAKNNKNPVGKPRRGLFFFLGTAA